ncbi:Ran-binding protein 17 [Smittium culicis]|uniref:Ran-binding protein 17 n=1 Tax=Smittium culicis TaxID=133412 RepID=A0A1R1Y0E0_9FUNG|nr:Ran-binding protein 17 [Smittium culicis]OMJ20279.1 Ran-binding protein 17 [Smittium culicis]
MNVDTEGPPTVESLDMLTNNLYTSANSEVRVEAENRLAYYFPTFSSTDSQELNISPLIQKNTPVSVYSSIKTPLDSISFLFWFLNNTRNDFSLFFASQRIKIIVIKFAFSFTMAQKKDLADTLFNKLAEIKMNAPRNLTSELSQSLAFVIMSGYLDSDYMSELIDKILVESNKDAFGKVIFFHVLNVIIEELNREITSYPVPKKERIDKTRELVLMESITLQKNIFLFSFVGFQCDESSDDITTIQLPTSWRTAFDAPELVDSYFIAYKSESASIQPLWSENSITPLLTFWLKSCSAKEYITLTAENSSSIDKKVKVILLKIVTCYMASLLTLATKSVSDDGLSDS